MANALSNHGTVAWVTRPEGRSQAGPKGRKLEVGARRAPRLLVKDTYQDCDKIYSCKPEIQKYDGMLSLESLWRIQIWKIFRISKIFCNPIQRLPIIAQSCRYQMPQQKYCHLNCLYICFISRMWKVIGNCAMFVNFYLSYFVFVVFYISGFRIKAGLKFGSKAR